MADDNIKLIDDLVHIVRLSVQQQGQQVLRLVRKMARSYSRSSPELSTRLVQLLQELPTTQAPLRSAEVAAIPVDQDSRLQLLRCEHPIVLETEPVWPSSVNDVLRQFCLERQQRNKLVAAGVLPSRSILLVGPPGVGKTLAARWMARELNLPLLTLDLSAVMSSYLGRTGINLRHVMDYAKGVQCVLLLDELDAIAKKRDDVAEVGELKRLVTVILQEIDEWPQSGILLGATNHPDLLDPAVWRRFDHVLQFPMPTRADVAHLVARLLGPDRVNPDMVEGAAIAFGGCSFSDVRRSIDRACRTAAVGDLPIEGVMLNMIAEQIQNLPRKARQELALQLNKGGISQHLAHRLTGVSRDTIRRRLDENQEPQMKG